MTLLQTLVTTLRPVMRPKSFDEYNMFSQYAVVANNLLLARLYGVPLEAELDGKDVSVPAIHAERFIFDVDVPVILGEFVRAGTLNSKAIFDMARDPAAVYWCEWRVEPEDDGPKFIIGALVDTAVRREFGETVVVFCAQSRQREYAKPFALVYAPTLPIVGGTTRIRPLWFAPSNEKGQKMTGDDEHELMQCYYDLLDVLFVLNTPRVSEVVEVKHDAKLQKARAKRGKPPLIEYKKCELQIGNAGVRYRNASDVRRQPGETDAEHKKRLHQVIGHFRTYRKGRETPTIAWVPSHWRGDAKLGILVHERTVRRPGPRLPAMAD